MRQKEGAHLLKLGIVGTILTCVACSTPAAVMILGLLGLARWAGYLDLVLFPLLGLFLILLGYTYWQRWHGERARARRRQSPDPPMRP
jgi:mercuric ion transport protein